MGTAGSLAGAEGQHPSYALLDQHNFTQVRCAPRGSAPASPVVCLVLCASSIAFRLVQGQAKFAASDLEFAAVC